MVPEYFPFKIVPISEASDALSKILPNAPLLSPDKIFSVAESRLLSPEFVRLENWDAQEFGNDIYSKAEIFDLMFRERPPESQLFFLPDDILSLQKGTALSYIGTNLREAILNFPRFVFDSDAVFVWPNENQVSVFHHGGGFFHVRA